MLPALLLAASAVCALMSLRAKSLLASALWLAAVSALVAALLYGLGAHEVAVVELSVGAGLVTVLLAFAINLAGDDAQPAPALLPRWLAAALVLAGGLLLAGLALPGRQPGAPAAASSFGHMLWQVRGLDVLLQAALIFAGTLAVLGLLSDEPRQPPGQPEAIPELAEREAELAARTPAPAPASVSQQPSPEEAPG